MASNKYRILFAICVSFASVAPGCGLDRAKESAASVGPSAPPPPQEAPGTPASASVETPATEQRLRQVIRKAELAFEVKSPSAALSQATSIAERHGGFVATSSTSASASRSSEPESVTATLRVPSDHFTKVLTELRKLSRGSGAEHVGSEDVSEECVDLDARLKTQRALEQQFLEILKRADKVEDALRVQREIATVRAEIERMEGRRRLLEHEVALSTIVLVFTQEKPLVTARWQDLGDAARQAYADAVDNAAGLITVSVRTFGALFPVALVFGAPAWMLVKRWRRRRVLRPAPASAQ